MKKSLQILLLLIFANSINAQEPNDCVNSIPVCGNGVFAYNPAGIGFSQEINSCGGYEHNSIWLKIHIAQSGTLGFEIIPNDPNIAVDYDFWVYSPNRNCSILGAPMRCCTTNAVQAGLTNNHTGMVGSTIITTSGPGADGNGYVRWLNALAGETYYIAIDRPIGDGGFELNWTGSAVLTSAPVANAVTDYVVCSEVPNTGIFDLSTKKSEINLDINNTIDFFATLTDATNNTSILPNTYTNSSNPQIIYARVTDNTTGCFSITQFNLVVNCLGINQQSSNILDDVKAQPNPFDNEFVIDFETLNQELVTIKVYDVLGKLIEQKIVDPTLISSQKLGQKYSSGIYNVVVTQGDSVKNLRVVKK